MTSAGTAPDADAAPETDAELAIRLAVQARNARRFDPLTAARSIPLAESAP